MRPNWELFALALAASLMFANCGKSVYPESSSVATNIPGVISVMTNLVAECQQLARDGASQGKEIWEKGDALPPTIKSLSPQVVQLLSGEAATVVDIQTSGGFQHRGYLVVCTSKEPNYEPRKGRNWKITRVLPGIFEYRE